MIYENLGNQSWRERAGQGIEVSILEYVVDNYHDE
jgi:hypothetical protein